MRKISSLIFLFSWFFCQNSSAQIMLKQEAGDNSNIYIVNELGAVLTDGEDWVEVKIVLPGDSRPEGYKNIKIQEKDEILMVNANRVRTVKAFQQIYDETAIGDSINLGIRREGELLITSFTKVDPAKLSKKMKIRISGSPESGERKIVRSFSVDPGAEEGIPIMGTGLALADKGNSVCVVAIMEQESQVLVGADIQKGDVIEQLNGQPILSLDRFMDYYDAIETNTPVNLQYRRDGESFQLSFKKPEMKGKIIIRK